MSNHDRPVSKENFIHVPVLKNELLRIAGEVFGERQPDLIVDGTLGEAGHTIAFHERFPGSGLLALDRDPQMMSRAQERLALEGLKARRTDDGSGRPPDNGGWRPGPGEVLLHRARFSGLGELLRETGARPDLILLDLGVSMFHFQGASRGFSHGDELLDMRLDPELSRTAADLVNRLPEKELSYLFATHGEERFSHRIARAIIRGRPYSSAKELSDLIARVMPAGPKVSRKGAGRKGGDGGPKRLHPATRVFQALRIAVNEEDAELAAALRDLPVSLAPGGIFCVISFHSGEDRMVKQAFREIGDKPSRARRRREKGRDLPGRERSGRDFWILTEKPLRPDEEEIAENPASRSARLRVLQKKADINGE